MGCILDNRNVALLYQGMNRIHIARNAPVMNGKITFVLLVIFFRTSPASIFRSSAWMSQESSVAPVAVIA